MTLVVNDSATLQHAAPCPVCGISRGECLCGELDTLPQRVRYEEDDCHIRMWMAVVERAFDDACGFIERVSRCDAGYRRIEMSARRWLVSRGVMQDIAFGAIDAKQPTQTSLTPRLYAWVRMRAMYSKSVARAAASRWHPTEEPWKWTALREGIEARKEAEKNERSRRRGNDARDHAGRYRSLDSGSERLQERDRSRAVDGDSGGNARAARGAPRGPYRRRWVSRRGKRYTVSSAKGVSNGAS